MVFGTFFYEFMSCYEHILALLMIKGRQPLKLIFYRRDPQPKHRWSCNASQRPLDRVIGCGIGSCDSTVCHERMWSLNREGV